MPTIRDKTFSGTSNVFNGVLASAMKAIIQKQTADIIVADAIADLTDNSGGAAADGTVGAIPAVTVYASAGTDLCQKAEMEAALQNVDDALDEILDQIIALEVIVPVKTLTNSLGGTNDGTIAAIDQDMTAVAASGVDAAGMNAVLVVMADVIARLVHEINLMADAVGATRLVDNSGGDPGSYALTFAAIDVDTGTATTTISVEETDGEAALVALAAAVKEMATKLNEIVGFQPTVAQNIAQA